MDCARRAGSPVQDKVLVWRPSTAGIWQQVREVDPLLAMAMEALEDEV
jgi:hypothetical protein